MAWTAMPLFTDGSALTGAQLNILRANLLETAAAKATTAGSHFVGTSLNTIAERFSDTNTVNTLQTTTSTSFTTALGGPAITLTTGTACLIFITAQMNNSTAGQAAYTSVAVSGATTIAGNDNEAVMVESGASYADMTSCRAMKFQSLTPGSNTFTLVYRVAGGTGTFRRRTIVGMAL